MSQIEVDKIIPQSGTSTQLGESGDTITIPAGATITNNGTANGFGSADTEKVKVSANDTTAGFLNGKLVAGTNISLTEGSDGGNETLTAALSGTIATSQIANDAITLDKMAPGTDGNIISYDASGNPVAVATGSAGQVLTSAGAGAPPTFAEAGGGMNFLSATSVTNASSVTVNPPFSSTYSAYKIIIVGMSPETTNQDLYFTFIKSDGSEETGANYRYTVGGFRESTTSTEGTGSASNCKWARNVNNDTSTINADILITNPQQSIRASIVGTSNKRFQNDAYAYAELFGCWMNPSTSYTQIKFFPGSGNWNAGGKIMVYGLKES